MYADLVIVDWKVLGSGYVVIAEILALPVTIITFSLIRRNIGLVIFPVCTIRIVGSYGDGRPIFTFFQRTQL